MAAGLPTVCFDHAGAGEMISPECGIKIKPLSPERAIADIANAQGYVIVDVNHLQSLGMKNKVVFS